MTHCTGVSVDDETQGTSTDLPGRSSRNRMLKSLGSESRPASRRSTCCIWPPRLVTGDHGARTADLWLANNLSAGNDLTLGQGDQESWLKPTLVLSLFRFVRLLLSGHFVGSAHLARVSVTSLADLYAGSEAREAKCTEAVFRAKGGSGPRTCFPIPHYIAPQRTRSRIEYRRRQRRTHRACHSAGRSYSSILARRRQANSRIVARMRSGSHSKLE